MSARLEGHLDGYALVEPVHRVGGEALIYRAIADSDGSVVAIRVALDDGACGDALRGQARWLREAAERPECGAAVLAPWDEGRWEGRSFLALSWLPDDLEACARRGDVDLRALLARVCDAVDALHRAGLAHGDLKPSNVLVSEPDLDPRPLLADPAPAGGYTPRYAAPERHAGEGPTPASDRYSVGALALELAAGPDGQGLQALPIRRAARRLTHPDPTRRPASLAGLAAALRGRPDAGRGWMPRLAAAALAGCAVALFARGLLAAALAPPIAPPCPSGLEARDTRCVDRDGLAFARVPAGRFRMGRPAEATLLAIPDAPPRDVAILRPFLLATTELTQASWATGSDEHPVRDRRQVLDGGVDAPCDAWKGHSLVGEALPVVCVSWLDAVRWLNARSERDGLRPAYRIAGDDVRWDDSADGWRLPTEAEWEYAARWDPLGPDPCARANTRDRGAPELWGGEAACEDGDPVLAPAGRRPPNRLGLHDLEGNALEWVWDRYGTWTEASAVDPPGPAFGRARVLKGGSWNHVARGPAGRYASDPSTWSYTTGFRVARTITPVR